MILLGDSRKRGKDVNNFKGMVRGTTIFIILCLATYGAFVLCKRPPDLTVSDEDRETLQKDHGIDILSNETTGGRSAMFNTVSGAPPISTPKSPANGNKALPAALAGPSSASSAPAYGDAPMFATATSETETPAFATAPSPSHWPPPPAIVQSAPLYGNQYPASPAPQPPVDQIQPAPNPPPSPVYPPIIVPTPPHVPPTTFPESLPVSPPALDPLPSFTPAPTSLLPTVPPQSPPTAPSAAFVPVSAFPTPSDSPWDGLATSIDEQPTVAPWGGDAAVPVNSFAPPSLIEKADTVTFVTPVIKPLPRVEEKPPTQIIVTTPVPMPFEAPSHPIPTTTTFPEEYRQASIRRISTVASPDEAPVVSFLPINPAPPPPRTEQAIEEPTIKTAQEKTAPPISIPVTSPPPPLAPTSVAPPASATLPSFVDPKTTPTVAVPESTLFAVESPILPEPIEIKPIVSLPAHPKEIKPEVREPVVRFIQAQYEQIQSNDPNGIRNAYIQLSRLYDHSELNPFERAYLAPILDHLAIDVIFSRRNHILESPYIARIGETTYTLRSGETLTIPYGNSIDSIASAFNLTSALLMKINGLTNKRPLEPGTKLKVVLGQFDGKISMERREFTLILGGLYAGRFPIAVGEDLHSVRGDFTVTLKGDTPQGRLLTLSNGVTLRGIDRPQPGDSLRSTVRLTERDANELYDILSERSIVVIAK